MAAQRHIRRIVIGILFLCFAICTLVVKQYLFTMLLGAAAYWITLSGIFETFSDDPDPETAHPARAKRWAVIGAIVFLAIAAGIVVVLLSQAQPHKTAEDIQLKVDRSGDPDAGLHQEYVTEPEDIVEAAPAAIEEPAEEYSYILNTNSMVFHKPDCGSVKTMSDKNKQSYTGTRESVVDMGYSACGNCNP